MMAKQRGEDPPQLPAARWRKVLYVRQPVDDNYVPDSFLQELVTNAGVVRPDIWTMMLATASITQQISIVAIFLVVFMYANEGSLSIAVLLSADVGLFLSGYAIWTLTSPRKPALLSTLWWFLFFGASLRVLSPVLRTLTGSYSTDTIYALTLMLLAVHLVSHDYSNPRLGGDVQSLLPKLPPGAPPPTSTTPSAAAAAPAPAPALRGTVSLNAAIFCAVLLASRLESNELVFCFMLLAMEVFAFFPIARRRVRQQSEPLHLAITALLCLTAALVLITRDKTLLVVYTALVLFITLACPMWLYLIHPWKFNIQGPWDIAHVQHSD